MKVTGRRRRLSWSTPGGHLDWGEDPERRHYVTIWMEADWIDGEAVVNAAEEMSEVRWFPCDALPARLFLPLRNLLAGRCFPPVADSGEESGFPHLPLSGP